MSDDDSNDEPVNSIGLEPDFVFKLKKIYRRKKSGELVLSYGTKNKALKISIFAPRESHPYLIGHYGTNEAVRGSIIMPAIFHNNEKDTVITYLQNCAGRANHPIKRIYYFVFTSTLAASMFESIFNNLLKNKIIEHQLHEEKSSEDEDDLYNETQPGIDAYYPNLE